jgi:hypothetical protein
MSESAPLSADRLLAGDRPRRPYPGLRPFETGEWSIFFGRERMIDDVIELLARRRLVVVHGASGSGKSSLIRAGVLPRLARQHLRHGVPWRTAAMRPSGGPLWNLAAALAGIDGRPGGVDRIEAIRRAFDRSGARLREVVADDTDLDGQRVCILVDQFEELFRYAREISRDESQLFIELLVGLLADDGDAGCHAVITMRSEYLGDCARYDGLAEAINRTQYLLPRMDREGLLRAIRRPAEMYGGGVDAELAERLVADAGGGQDELPLIQHALMLLWNEASANDGGPPRLGLDRYRRQEGGIVALLSDHADRVMAAAAPEPARQIVVELLFRALTDVNADGQGIRRPQRFDRLVAVTGAAQTVREIVEAFRAEGVSFLTPYPPAPLDDATVVDISHEALIRNWRQLRDWVAAEIDDGRRLRKLLNDVRLTEERKERGEQAPIETETELEATREWWFDPENSHRRRVAWLQRYRAAPEDIERIEGYLKDWQNYYLDLAGEARKYAERAEQKRKKRNAALLMVAVITLFAVGTGVIQEKTAYREDFRRDVDKIFLASHVKQLVQQDQFAQNIKEIKNKWQKPTITKTLLMHDEMDDIHSTLHTLENIQTGADRLIGYSPSAEPQMRPIYADLVGLLPQKIKINAGGDVIPAGIISDRRPPRVGWRWM